MKATTTVSVDSSRHGERLDAFLAHTYPTYSRTYFQDLIKQGKVLINDAATKPSHILKEHDHIRCCFLPPKPLTDDAAPAPFDIVATTPEFLIINKPAGTLVHKTTTRPNEPTLVSGLLATFEEFKTFNDHERPGIVHRLDRNTSGLMIVARNLQAQNTFATLFKQRAIHKTYLALVEGHPAQKKGVISFPIGRDPFNPTKMSHRGINSREALSFYTVIASYKSHSLLSVHIITGRTHQIRVHCAAIGHSIVGDAVYGKKSTLITRQALHAWKISFDYNNTAYSYTQPVPEDFLNTLKTLSS